MNTIEKLADRNHNGPLKSPLRVIVAAVGNVKAYGTADKKMLHVSVCDPSGVAKAVLFDESKFNDFKERSGLVLHNAIFKNREIIVNAQTKVFRCAIPTVPDNIMQQAVDLIRPQTPEVLPIKDARKSPSKTRVSIRGKITSDGLSKPVTINGRQVQVKTISVQDADDEIKVSLWRDLAKKDLQLGEIVEVTHVVVNGKLYNGEESLSTTQFSDINSAELPTEESDYQVLGIEVEDTTCQLMTCANGVLSSNTELLLTHFLCTLEELPEKFPCSLRVKVKGQEIVKYL
ncbi:uncharacterized protein LOC128559363 [Mercenaria mercenaria]|uniref:uncharacterized protein LOC128559363 n=1 Tax=Mercenaria mercenaria TaxID=6596 RepID=UPI00234F1388|nr:uncharacterized protein LOC128559363 [Mercenaria mercenaria]